ncbi:MAG: CoA-binding protein [Candidatus Goldbacteria bacterium]|nr:CoA-binding protein [Candidatus Goldiibacteriota bacterium]
MGIKERVVVLGASHKPERYSYKAIQALLNNGHEVIPVNPALKEVLGLKVINKLEEISGKVDTVTLYVGPERLAQMADEIVNLKPKRIIANPGAESEIMRLAADKNKIEYEEACTLVLLSTGQF